MCDLFGGSSEPRTQTVINRSESTLPKYVERGGEELYTEGKQLAGREFPAYDAPRLAEFSDDTRSAFDLVRDSTGEWRAPFEQATTQVGANAGPVTEGDISRYMNPFTENVADAVTGRINQQFGRDLIDLRGAAAQRGSMLNDRMGVIEGTAAENKNRVLSETLSNLFFGAHNQALGQANTDRARGMQGAGMYGTLATQIPGLVSSDVNALSQVGGKQEALDQANLGLRYEDFLTEFNYPQEQVNWLASLLNRAPYNTSAISSSTSPIGSPNPFAQVLGAGATIAGMGNQFGFWGPQ